MAKVSDAEKKKIEEELRRKIEQENKQKELERLAGSQRWEARKQQVGAVGGAVAKIVKGYNPGIFTIIFVLSWIEYYFAWQTGFQGSGFVISLDVALLILFFFGFGIEWAAVPTIFYLLIPLTIGYGVLPYFDYLLVLPLWVISAVFYKIKKDPQSKSTKFLSLLVVGIIILLLYPIIQKASSTAGFAPNYGAVNDAKDFVVEQVSSSFKSISDSISVQMCTYGGKSEDTCKKEILKTGQDIGQYAQLSNSEKTQFTMNIMSFVGDSESVNQPKIKTDIGATNNMDNKVTVSFGCGFEEKGKGTPNPAEMDITGEKEHTIICENLNISKGGTPSFYFNMSAKGLMTYGSTDFAFVGDIAKPNEKFSQDLNQISDSIGYTRAGNDLVQPIILIGLISGRTTPTPTIHAIGEEYGTPDLDLAISLKNNGKGRITNIQDVKVNLLSSDFRLDPENCGITPEYLRTRNWHAVVPDSTADIQYCKLVPTRPIEFPNTVSTRTVSITMKYDYSIDKSRQVIVEQRITST